MLKMGKVNTIILVVILALGGSLAKVPHNISNDYDYSGDGEINDGKEDNSPKMTAFPMEVSTSPYCGVDVISYTRSIGGVPTKMNQYPWLVAIENINIKSGFTRWICGGSLISGLHVLSAAHCFNNSTMGEKPINVILGDYNIRNDGPECVLENGRVVCSNGELRIKIKKVVVHPHYNETTRHHDIALIRLTEMAPFTDAIRPICLPSKDLNFVKKNHWFYVAGWGNMIYSDKNTNSPVKTHVDLPFVNLKICQNNWKNRGLKVTTHQICAGGNNKSPCSGDSGGPLMYNNGGQFELAGVVSYTGTGCDGNIPGVYTNVFRYKDWIMREIQSFR